MKEKDLMNIADTRALKELLEEKVTYYNTPAFIADDPIAIPRGFFLKQDVEIMGFLAAIMAWGQRKTIINKCMELIRLMDGAPHDFVKNHQPTDRKRFENFKHRTFLPIDILYFMDFFHWYFNRYDSLEDAFVEGMQVGNSDLEQGLIHFHNKFFSLADYPERTKKHIATPARKSGCKRLNMFLRWMVRKDSNGVDFGIWQNIQPYQLVCPVDVHVGRVARTLGLLERKQTDWQAALELTNNLKDLDHKDPVKYDFALFGLGKVEGVV